MKRFELMRVEDVGQPGGNTLPLLDELDRIGRRSTPSEGNFQRRMLRLAGFDLDHGISLDPAKRAIYVAAVNRIVATWNALESPPTAAQFEAALRTYLGVSGIDSQ